MKKVIRILLCFIIIFHLLSVVDASAENADYQVIEISSWEEFYNAFRQNVWWNDNTDTHFIMKLNENLHMDLAAATQEERKFLHVLCCGYVTFDFNGHVLSCTNIDPENKIKVGILSRSR